MSTKISCLLVEDEVAIRDMIRFSIDDMTLIEADDTPMAEKKLLEHIPDIIILDWMLPSKSGIDFIHWVKKHNIYNDIPIIMLTAKAEEHNKIRGLEAGADDYITKPFSPKELYTRIKTVLRRGRIRSGVIQIHQLKINTDAHEVFIEDEKINLTTNEYKLLELLAKHPKRTFTREQLINHVWGTNSYIDERTVDGQIRRLRDQLKKWHYGHIIKTVRGMGYQLVLAENG